MKRNTAIIVGHDQNEQGGYSPIIKMTEYQYNCRLADFLCETFDIYYRPIKGGYTSKMRKLANHLNKKSYKNVLELHFNLFDGKANKKGHGCEAVIYRGNLESALLSNKLLTQISKSFNIHNRGVLERDNNKQRGFEFLYRMKANSIIYEPFFGDEKEAEKFLDFQKHADILKSILP
jgi:N-acetylmuramoyl-L-alanine amidase